MSLQKVFSPLPADILTESLSGKGDLELRGERKHFVAKNQDLSSPHITVSVGRSTLAEIFPSAARRRDNNLKKIAIKVIVGWLLNLFVMRSFGNITSSSRNDGFFERAVNVSTRKAHQSICKQAFAQFACYLGC